MSRLSVISLPILLVLVSACSSSGTLPEPPCRNPAPYNGTFPSTDNRYIVIYHDDVAVEATTAELAERYGFTPRYVWSTLLLGFAADLSPEQVTALRCETAIQSISVDGHIKGT
jgi:hypothetical protein